MDDKKDIKTEVKKGESLAYYLCMDCQQEPTEHDNELCQGCKDKYPEPEEN